MEAMNSDLLLEVSKYVDRTTGIKALDVAYESTENLKQHRKNASGVLSGKLTSRPTQEELEKRNILRKEVKSFDYIHSVLESIDFREGAPRISPRIASLAKKLDFELKRKMIIRKLGLDKK